MKAVATFFFVLLSAVSFAQIDSTQIAQPYGAPSLVTTQLDINKKGQLIFTITSESFGMEVLFVEHKNGKKQPFVNKIAPSTSDTQYQEHEFVLNGTDVNDIYIKTPKGVTSINIYKQGKIYYATVNGEFALAFDKEFNLTDEVDVAPDYFKDAVAWQYNQQFELL